MRDPLKPPALKPGSRIAVVSPASSAEPESLSRGCEELARLGYAPGRKPLSRRADGYFAAATGDRRAELLEALRDENVQAVFCARGGYGANYLLEGLDTRVLQRPRILLGHSDITSLEIFLWQKLGWVTFYGPMVAAGFDGVADAAGGYDSESFARGVTQTRGGWRLDLRGETLAAGEAEGTLLGGCLTLVEATLGTPWELDTAGSILLLEDRAVKPYQLDRMLMHLKQAGKLAGVRGVLLGEFPESAPPAGSQVTVRDVCQRILGELGVPVVWGAPIGHTPRAMLTVPLGVRARLRGSGPGQLDILEPAVTP